jgi:hypothetical protein
MVRRSWLTPVSIAVRCSIWRSMRSRIWMKAKPARRTSSAPRGRKLGGIGRPLPKLSAASASCRIGRIWLRRKGDGDRQKHKRGADHPQQEDVGVRGISLAAADEDAQHLVVELDANLDDVGAADRVEPERSVDLPADFGRKRLSRIEKNGFGPGGGRGSGGSRSIFSDMRSWAMRMICA